MPSRKALSLTAAAAAIALGLSGCGGNGGDEQETDALQFGYILPETGDLSHLGPPQVSSVEYAIQEINEAGGVLDRELPDVLAGDEANDAAQANDAADRLIGQGADAIIGAAASGMSMAVIDRVTGAEVVQCSGSNTAPDFSDYEDGGYYFRTAPSDELQGPVLAEKLVNDGHQSVAITYRSDDYGQGLAEFTADALEEQGVEIALNEGYDPNATNFDSIIQQIDNSDADAALLVSFEEGEQILTGLMEAGLEPDQLYSGDGMRSASLGEDIDPDDPGVISGFQGTAPGAEAPEFHDGLREFDSELNDLQYAAQVYDCVVSIALAAEAAGSAEPTDFVGEMANISKDGQACAGFGECRDLLAEGEDIDYEGVSGPIAFDENGDVSGAAFEVYNYDENGEMGVEEHITADEDEE